MENINMLATKEALDYSISMKRNMPRGVFDETMNYLMPKGSFDELKDYLMPKGSFDEKKNYLMPKGSFDKKKNHLRAKGGFDKKKNHLRAKGGFDKKKNHLRAKGVFDKKKNHLKALPLELREMIFRKVLIPAGRDHVVNIREPSSSDIQRQEEEAIFTRCILNQYAPRKGEKKRIEKPLKASRCALMFTCRQFRNEAGQIYFGLNKFNFYQKPTSKLLKNFCEDEWTLNMSGPPTFLLAPDLLTNIRIRLTPGISHYLLSFQNLRHLQIFYEKQIDDSLNSEIAHSVRSSKWERFLENHRYLEDIKVDEDSWDFSLLSVYPELGRLIIEMNTALRNRKAARSIKQLDS